MKKRVSMLCLLFLFFVPHVSAQQVAEFMPETPLVTSLAAEQIQYDLPYPGLLPDAPLYWLKTTRDRLVSFFISDPVKKAEFNLLQADKRLQASVLLVAKNKKEFPLAASTISKGENYFEEAISQVRQADTQGRDTAHMKNQLFQAVKKHTLLIDQLAQTAPPQQKSEFMILQKRVQVFHQRIAALMTSSLQ